MSELQDHSQRDHALLSASSAHRWLACPPSAVAAEKYPDPDTDFTREGTLAHEVAEAIARGFVIKGYYTKAVWDDGSFTIDEAKWNRADITQEMIDRAEAYANYIQELMTTNDPLVLLEQRVDFSPWVPEGFGTCDCILIQGDTLTIIDYKYGQGVTVSAVDNPQMKLYALGALNDYGIALDVARVEMHIFQPRINNISRDSLTVEELTTWAEKTVKPIAQKAIKGKGAYEPGEHCRFCPHSGRCRALTKVCTEYVTAHGMRAAVPVLAPWEVAEVLRMEPLVSLWLKKVKAQALTDLLDGKEVPGYKVVAGKEGNRKWTDELQVAEALKGAGYSQEDYTETKLLSPAGMDKAIGKKKAAELLEQFIHRPPGAPAVVPATDKRPAYDRLAEAQKDFI